MSTTEPPWLAVARGEIGIKEIPGPNLSNPRIEEYLRTTRAGPHAVEDVPWCAAFVMWVLQQTGIPGTGALAARSYMKWGVPLARPIEGCVCVLWRENPKGFKGHIGFWLADDRDKLVLLGGNQANAVMVRPYPRARLLGFRWPTQAALTQAALTQAGEKEPTP